MASQEHVLLSTEQYNRILQKIKDAQINKSQVNNNSEKTSQDMQMQHKESKDKKVVQEKPGEKSMDVSEKHNLHPSTSNTTRQLESPTEKNRGSAITTPKRMEEEEEEEGEVDNEEKEINKNHSKKKQKRKKMKHYDSTITKITGQAKQGQKLTKQVLIEHLKPPGIAAKKSLGDKQKRKTKKKWVKLTA